MATTISNTPNSSQLYDYAEYAPSKSDVHSNRNAFEAESHKSDWQQTTKDILSAGTPALSPVDYSGEIKKISPSSSEATVRDIKGLKPQDEGEISIVMDNGLKATVNADGIKFDQLNTANEGSLGAIAAWYSRLVGELDFSELQKSSIGPGEGGFADRIGNPGEGHVDFKTQRATVALYDALQNVDKGKLSDAQAANVDKVLAQLKPFLSIPARSDAIGKDYRLNNIQADKHGGIELEYSGQNKTKDVVVKDDMISVEYYQRPESHSPFGINPTVIDDVKVELDLSKIGKWTPEQKREAGDLKAALENVDKDALTADELKARDDLLMKLEDVPTTLQSVVYDNGKESIGGSAFSVYLDKVNPGDVVTIDDSGAIIQPHTDSALSPDVSKANPPGEY